MLDGVAETAATNLRLVEGIGDQMRAAKHRTRAELPKLDSQKLLNDLFRHPYTWIDYVLNNLTVTRQTAARNLDTLAEHGFVEKQRAGKNNYYVNTSLVRLLMTVSEGWPQHNLPKLRVPGPCLLLVPKSGSCDYPFSTICSASANVAKASS